MPSKEWIERDDQERLEADLAETRSIRAILTIVALVLLVILTPALVRCV